MIKDHLEKVYSGFLGMDTGTRLGASVEPIVWTCDRVRDTYGETMDYVKDFKNFMTDDDVNSPVHLLRALCDDTSDRPFEPQDMARVWLNCAREGVGMSWWGGYSRSTEHTAYLNPKAGILVSCSGSVQRNDKTIVEQIGGQILINTWGPASPRKPHRAAEYGATVASVSHSGEGVYGVRFFCIVATKAFETNDINEIMNTGFVEILEGSFYRKIADVVLSFHVEYPDDWRVYHQMLTIDWGYNKYGGVCHVISSVGVCILVMTYGQGDFVRIVGIATICEWDTDCNAENVGTVLGVACGIDGLLERYRDPINDGLVFFGISGYLSILDVPTYCKEVAALDYRIIGEEILAGISDSYRLSEVYFDFELLGSIYNMCVSDSFLCRIWYSIEQAAGGTGSLRVLVDRMECGHQYRLFYRPFYHRDDSSNERYSPVSIPITYPGRTVSTEPYLDQRNGWETIGIAPYMRTTSDRKDHLQGYIKLQQSKQLEVSSQTSDTGGGMVDEAGIVIKGYSPAESKTLGILHLDDLSITGRSEHRIAPVKQKTEFGCVTPFLSDHDARDLDGGQLFLMCYEPVFAYADNYHAMDYTVTTSVASLNGDSHLLTIHAQGAMRGYVGGPAVDGTMKLYKNDFGYRELSSAALEWEQEQAYELSLKVVGNTITLLVNGKKTLSAKDDSYRYDMLNCGSLSIGRIAFGDFIAKEE